ncbi:hypothetical protein GQ600_2734 [Phytophthora cactorum]|nr:hypothetical protein GQ600_2734 [Phytophthora cactorum]
MKAVGPTIAETMLAHKPSNFVAFWRRHGLANAIPGQLDGWSVASRAQSYDFPAMLYGIEFCYTNLRELPDDLDTKWMIGSSIYIEYSNLTNVPLLLTRLDPYYLALAGNPIVELPVEILRYQACIIWASAT